MKTILKNKSFVLLLFVYLVLSITVNIIHPVTTVYVNQLHLPEAYFGFFFATMSFGQFIGAIFWGFASDKIGRKIPFIIGILGYAIGQFLFGFVNTIPWLIILFRIFAGFFVCNCHISAPALTLDYVKKEERTSALSLIAGMSILGGSIGYEIGGALFSYASLTIQQLFILQIVLCLLTSLLVILLIKEKRKEPNELEIKKNHNPFSHFKGLSPIIFVFLIAILLMNIGQINISKYLDVLIIDLGYEPATLGHFVLFTGIVGFFANVVLIPLIKRKNNIKEEILIVIFIVLSAACIFIEFNVRANLLVLLYTLHMLYTLFKSLITPLEQNYIARFSSEKTYGSVMGARQSIMSLGNMIGPLLGSAIYLSGSVLIMNISAFVLLGSLLIYTPIFIINKKVQKTK